MKLPRNMCRLDQFARFTIGASCVYVGFVETAYIDQVLINALVGLFGLVNLFAGATAFCPVYHTAGITSLATPVNRTES